MAAAIFFLDDDVDLIFAFQQIAESCGCEVISATSVRSMIDQASEILSCKIAFLDIQLGRGEPNGIDALGWLLDNNFGGRINILTGHARSGILGAEALEKARGEILTKPISSRLLKRFIEEGLSEYKC